MSVISYLVHVSVLLLIRGEIGVGKEGGGRRDNLLGWERLLVAVKRVIVNEYTSFEFSREFN